MRPRQDTFVVVVERILRQTARIEVQADSLADAEGRALLLARHDGWATWDDAGQGVPHVLHVEHWDTRQA